MSMRSVKGCEAVVGQECVDAGLVGADADVGAADEGCFGDALQGEVEQEMGVVGVGVVGVDPEADPGTAFAPEDLDAAGEAGPAVVVEHVAGHVDLVRVEEDGRDAFLLGVVGGVAGFQLLCGQGGNALVEFFELGFVGGLLRPQVGSGRGAGRAVEAPDGDLGEGDEAGLSEGIDEEGLVGQVR